MTKFLCLVGIGEAESVQVTRATKLELVLGRGRTGTGLAGNRLLDGYLYKTLMHELATNKRWGEGSEK